MVSGSKHKFRLLASWCAAGLAVAVLGGAIAPAAEAKILPPSGTQFALIVRVNGDRLSQPAAGQSGTGIAGLQGVTLQLSDKNHQAVADPWGTCTSDADGDCTFLVPVAEMPSTSTVEYYATLKTAPAGWVDATPADSVKFSFPRPASGGNGTAASNSIILARPNPALAASCGQNALKVAFVADLSGSMDEPLSDPAIKTMKKIAQNYVKDLAQTDAQIALFTFSDKSPATASLNNVNRPITEAKSGVDQLTSWINGWVAGGFTNWDDALWKVANYGLTFDFVILLTDGTPTASTNSSLAMDNSASANAVKLKGTRIIVVGVGLDFAPVTIDFISGVSGPVTGNSNPAKNDYFLANNWTDVEGLFKSLATICSVSSASVNVKFVDDVTGGEVAPVSGFDATLTGVPGDAVKFGQSDAEKGFDTKKYKFESMESVTEFTAEPQTITVHLGHKVTSTSVDVTRTIHYTGVTPAIPDQVDKITWSTTTDEVTGASQCTTTSASYPAVSSPNVAGYTANPVVVPEQPVPNAPAVCPPPNSETTVTYTKVPDGSVSIVFIDDVTGEQVAPRSGFNTLLYGEPGTAVSFTEDDAKQGVDATKYVFVSLASVPTFTTAPQTITVHVTHKLTEATVDVTRTIHYEGVTLPIGDWVDKVTWTKTTDLVTGTSQCTTTAAGYPAVTSPNMPGYTVSPVVVPALPVSSPSDVCPPADTETTVTYTKIPDGSVNIVFIDDVTGEQVAPKDEFVSLLSGEPGTLVNFTEDDARQGINTAKYVFVSLNNVQSFAIDPQTITVHITHKTVSETVDVTRTIKYSGAGARTPAAVVQTVAWTKTTDLVTQLSSCKASAGDSYPAVKSPIIVGYLADLAQVPALTLESSTDGCQAGNVNVAVTYRSVIVTVQSGGRLAGWPVVPVVAGSLIGLVALSLFGVYIYRRRRRTTD